MKKMMSRNAISAMEAVGMKALMSLLLWIFTQSS
jgi:hypothetical protein